MKKISILGSTGSIGTQALEVIAAHPEQFKVVGLAGRGNIELLQEQIEKFHPQVVAVGDEVKAKELKKRCAHKKVEIIPSDAGLDAVASLNEADMVLVAVTGVATLGPTLEAIKKGKDIALASKEILVSAGHIVMNKVRKKGVKFIPVDSEHSALMQALHPAIHKKGYLDYHVDELERLIITASGGPFLNTPLEELEYKNVDDALRHPTWNMGRKITIDSATLFNKGLEVIEAHWLFNVGYEKISVVIHPQSIVHSLVEFVDGSIIAQMGTPDMRLPIQYALSYPKRLKAVWPKLQLQKIPEWKFYEPDMKKFPALGLAYEAGRQGGTMPTVLNAANERAVELFLENKIKMTDIAVIIEQVMNKHKVVKDAHLKDILYFHAWARNMVEEIKTTV
jgi:1-deoxy-D-xylulose-5-phosphate reductoisomerase